MIVDHSGTIVIVNHQTEILFGYGRDELVGQPIEILLPEHVREMDTSVATFRLKRRFGGAPVKIMRR